MAEPNPNLVKSICCICCVSIASPTSLCFTGTVKDCCWLALTQKYQVQTLKDFFTNTSQFAWVTFYFVHWYCAVYHNGLKCRTPVKVWVNAHGSFLNTTSTCCFILTKHPSKEGSGMKPSYRTNSSTTSSILGFTGRGLAVFCALHHFSVYTILYLDSFVSPLSVWAL